ncbi:dihydroorotase [candidate division KSB1 bacterium]|nr:dihydroorotase [candidate division KSB1 bacterium]
MNTIKANKVLFKNGETINIRNGERLQVDVVVLDGKIDRVGHIEEKNFAGKVLDVKDHLIVPGLMDMHVHFREPGREDEETIETGCAAAMAGGITAVCTMPNTDPPCDTQEIVRFIKKRAEAELVDVFPIACITKKREGKEISEIADLVRAGAVALSDDGNTVIDNAVMRRALEYASMYEVPVIDHCEDPALSAGGQINEGIMSTRLGLLGNPDISEAIIIARDLALAEFTGGHIHIAHLSTAKGVELVRRGKEMGIKVTCEVTPHHLALTETALSSFDTNLKMAPPLRTAMDVEALLIGLRDGTVDAIASDHAPHAIEEKDVEFDAAPFGILGLETMLGIILTRVVRTEALRLHEALYKMTMAPREVLRMPLPQIKKGEPANLTIFNPESQWKVDKKMLKSRSRNMPYDGWKLHGRVFAVCNKGLIHHVD